MSTNTIIKGAMVGMAIGLLSDVISKYIPGTEV